MGPCGVIMSKDEGEITFPQKTTVTISGIPATIDSGDNVTSEVKESFEDMDEELGTDDLKPCTFMGVTFPVYFQGPHWIQNSGVFMLAVDPAYVSMQMKAQWTQRYAPELMALGKKILEDNLHIEIGTV